MPDEQTEELSTEQVRKELVEQERAKESTEPGEERTHARRAERAGYLREKLRERGKSEDEAEREG
jgi:hypothetical protein